MVTHGEGFEQTALLTAVLQDIPCIWQRRGSCLAGTRLRGASASTLG